MDTLVISEIIGSVEAFVASTASEGSLTGVDAFVIHELAGVLETLPAFIA